MDAEIKGLNIGRIQWNPTFNATRDDKGLWTGSMTFDCRKSDIASKVPARGSSCPAEGFGFMKSEGISVKDRKGDLYTVEVSFTGSDNSASFDDDEEVDGGTSELIISTSPTSLFFHPRYRNIDREIITYLKALRDGQLELLKLTGEDPVTMIELKQVNRKNEGRGIVIEDEMAIELALKLLKGIHEYLRAEQIFRYTISSTEKISANKLNAVGKKTINPYFKGTLSNSRDWLFTGINSAQRGEVYTYSFEWRLSDFGGWDDDIYNITDEG